MVSIRHRLERLENQRRFLDWFVQARFIDSLTDEEREIYRRDGKLSAAITNRPSSLDRLDRKSLIKLWKEDERIFGGRGQAELECYARNGFWPEQKGQFHYSMEDGKMIVEWQIEPEEEE